MGAFLFGTELKSPPNESDRFHAGARRDPQLHAMRPADWDSFFLPPAIDSRDDRSRQQPDSVPPSLVAILCARNQHSSGNPVVPERTTGSTRIGRRNFG